MKHNEYLVTGKRNYRGHAPGTVFQAVIERGAEQRAIARRDIQIVRRVRPALQPGSFTFPRGWLERR